MNSTSRLLWYKISACLFLVGVIFLLSLSSKEPAAASPGSTAKASGQSQFENPFSEPDARGQNELEFIDPFEKFPNRRVFAFNKFFFFNGLQPVTSGYEKVTTGGIRTGVRNFFRNLKEPVTVVNALLQFRPGEAGTATTRFLVNTTVGVAGFFDPAGYHIRRRRRTFDQTLAKWSVPAGPYVMYPILGPTTVRGFVAGTAEFFMNPFAYVGGYAWLGTTALKEINNNSYRGDQVADIFRYSIDPYVATKDGFEQTRLQLYRR